MEKIYEITGTFLADDMDAFVHNLTNPTNLSKPIYLLGLVLLLLSWFAPLIQPYLPVSSLAAVLITFVISLPNLRVLVRLWTFDST